jgi:hypothetical protein
MLACLLDVGLPDVFVLGFCTLACHLDVGLPHRRWPSGPLDVNLPFGQYPPFHMYVLSSLCYVFPPSLWRR